MSDDHIKPEILPYLAGGLTETRNRQIEAHLAACDKCRAALSKARSKQARVKREALKRATDPVPNLFLARQGKTVSSPGFAKKKWIAAGILLVVVAGYWIVRQPAVPTTSPLAETKLQTETTPEPAEVKASNPTTAVTPEVPQAPLNILVQDEWKGPDSAIKDPRMVVIRDQVTWATLWDETKFMDAQPIINFNEHVVIGVFAGPQVVGTTLAFGKIQDAGETISRFTELRRLPFKFPL